MFAAERLGGAILNGAGEVHAGALNHIKERLGEDEVASRLAALRARNHLIAAYLDAQEGSRATMDARHAERDLLMDLSITGSSRSALGPANAWYSG